MSTSPTPPGGGPEPAPAAPPLSAVDVEVNDDLSPLLDLLQRFPHLFDKYVLERLDPAARADLARTGSAFWDLVFPRSIFPLGLLHAETPAAAGAARVFKLVDFLGTDERLAWAKANGCPWDERTCRCAARGGHLEALRWEHGCPWHTEQAHSLVEAAWEAEDAAEAAAVDAARAALAALSAAQRRRRRRRCPWSGRTSGEAARGVLDVAWRAPGNYIRHYGINDLSGFRNKTTSGCTREGPRVKALAARAAGRGGGGRWAQGARRGEGAAQAEGAGWDEETGGGGGGGGGRGGRGGVRGRPTCIELGIFRSSYCVPGVPHVCFHLDVQSIR
jgi:hypothetical protein